MIVLERRKRCYLVVYGDGAGMVSLAMTIVAITPIALMLSLSASMYKLEQHL
jgi:hypothetical protein